MFTPKPICGHYGKAKSLQAEKLIWNKNKNLQQFVSTTVNSPLAKPKIQASKTEVIQGWEGFEVTCEVDMPSRSSLDLIWDYPGKGVSCSKRLTPLSSSLSVLEWQGLE